MPDQLEEALREDVAQFTHDPQGFALYAYPWGEGELAESRGPRAWQTQVNGMLRDHLSNPATRYQPVCIAVASGHGIGKSAEISQLVHWAMSTCEDCKVVITAECSYPG